MDFNSLDLNINNYSIEDIFNLFNISDDYDINSLKAIKRKVLKLHPDKSNMHSKYFLFFKKAYEILVKIYQFRNNNNKNIEDLSKSIDIQNHLNQYFKNKPVSQFNKEFNEIFENVYLKDDNESNGYDEWLKSNNDFIEKESDVETYKEKSIQKYDNEIESFNFSNNGYYDYNDKASFSNNDLKKVYYEETVIPINEKDILNNKQSFNNVNELNNFRTKDLNETYNNLSKEKSQKDLDILKQKENEDSIYTAYKLIQKQEKYNQNYNNEVSKYLKLKNKI
ncbi:hypothetical protein CL656_05300 [bacterium]|nr:hypothetical protein [bacterium]